MSWWYCLKEAFDGLTRAKLAALIAALTMAGALVLMGLFALAAHNFVEIAGSLRSRIELEIFVDNARDESGIQKLRRQIETVPGVAKVKYVSRQEATEIFRKEFGDGFIDLLASNPLPPSFQVALQKSHQHSLAAQQLASRLRALDGVDEVVYRRDFVQQVERYIDFAMLAGLVIGLVVCLGSLFVVINHVRLVAYAKRRTIETMQLVGATRFFVATPLLLQGLFQGIAGSALAWAFFYLLQKFLLSSYPEIIRFPSYFMPALAGFGILLGLVAAYLGVKRYIK